MPIYWVSFIAELGTHSMLSNPIKSSFRKSGRFETSKPAAIVPFNGSADLNCTLRNYSHSGAQLELDKSAHTSKQFQLLLKKDRKIVDCDVIWRRGNRIGVTFLSDWKSVDPRTKSRSLSELVIENYRYQLSA